MTEFRKKYPGVVKNVPHSIRSLGSKWTGINHDQTRLNEITARLNEKALERASKRKKGKGTTTYGTQSSAQEDYSPKESATPEIVTDRPIGNKKAKELATIKKKANKNKNALAKSTNAIAIALNQRAKVMEYVFKIQLFSLDIRSLDYKARQFMLAKREFAELELQKHDENVALV
ncbi:unnamed protein product [Calypogeia fissa]